MYLAKSVLRTSSDGKLQKKVKKGMLPEWWCEVHRASLLRRDTCKFGQINGGVCIYLSKS